MALQGPRSPSNFASIGTGVVWSLPGNVGASDNARASSSLNDVTPESRFLRTTGYGFSIPDFATLVGIVVEVEASTGLVTAGAIIEDSNVTLRGGTGASNNLGVGANDFTGTDVYYSWGSATNIAVWGMTFTVAQINNAIFGLDFKAKIQAGSASPPYAGAARVDHCRITVYYHVQGALRKQIRHGKLLISSVGPSSGGTFATSGGTGIAWTDPLDAASSNDSRTRATLSSSTELTTELLQVTNFGLSLPSGATPRGIVVEVEKSTGTITSGANITDLTVSLSGGGGASSNKASATTYGTTDAYTTYGSATDLWGTTWTKAQIEASAFGINFASRLNQGSAGTPYTGQTRVDHVRVTVYYSL